MDYRAKRLHLTVEYTPTGMVGVVIVNTETPNASPLLQIKNARPGRELAAIIGEQVLFTGIV